jgi:hypothetical protein
MTDQVALIPSRLNKKGVSESRATLTPSSDTRDKVILCNTRPCVPVIFLPGVMGTNLKSLAGKSVWAPPNASGAFDIMGAIGSAFCYFFRDAATRQTRLNPSDTMVDDDGDIDVGPSGLSREQAKERGWGEVHKMSYHKSLAYLQWTLNHPMLDGEPSGDWLGHKSNEKDGTLSHNDKAVIGTEPGDFGAVQPRLALTKEGLAHYSHFQYPVHAVGYNWTQSNGDSAKLVFARIKAICDQYGEGTKAIVITHSMGGIVGRALAELVEGGKDLIYGILHGAQPATGAPLVAKRFRTGAESLGVFFGRDDAEWTAVAANALSALELMPMPDYREGKPWWFISDNSGNPVLALPKKAGGSVDGIYVNSAWYGMVPDDRLIDPAGILKKTEEVSSGKKTVRGVFENSMATVADFQVSIAKKYHPNTYALYGAGELLVSQGPSKSAKALSAYGTVTWKGPLPLGTTESDLLSAVLLDDDHRGKWKIRVRGQVVTLNLAGPDEPGDGTVPATSATAQQGGHGVQAVFKQGGFEHQYCFDHPWARWATLYAMAEISKVIPEPV